MNIRNDFNNLVSAQFSQLNRTAIASDGVAQQIEMNPNLLLDLSGDQVSPEILDMVNTMYNKLLSFSEDEQQSIVKCVIADSIASIEQSLNDSTNLSSEDIYLLSTIKDILTTCDQEITNLSMFMTSDADASNTSTPSTNLSTSTPTDQETVTPNVASFANGMDVSSSGTSAEDGVNGSNVSSLPSNPPKLLGSNQVQDAIHHIFGGANSSAMYMYDINDISVNVGTTNGPTLCFIIILWFLNGPLGNAMKTSSAEVAALGTNGDIVNDTLTTFLAPIAEWAAANSAMIDPAAGTAINLFDATYAWLKNFNPSSPFLGTPPSGCPSSLDASCGAAGSLNSVFEGIFNAIVSVNQHLNQMFGTDQVYIDIGSMISGDTAQYSPQTILTPTTPTTPSNVSSFAQQLVMSALVEPTNTAGYEINGLTSTPVFPPSIWNNVTGSVPNATWDPTGGTSGNQYFNNSTNPTSSSFFYNIADSTSTNPNYAFFLTANSINSNIGNSSQSSSTGVGAISSCLRVQTAVGSTNAELTGMLNLLSTDYGNLTSILQNILPAIKLPG